MIPKRLEDITKDDIVALQRDEVRERRDLEYKLTLPGGSDADRKEFLADVSSFANAAGGDLIFGVKAKDGVPVAAPGLTGFNPDGGSLSLEQMIRDGIDPRVPGVRPWPVPGFEEGPVLILRIPKSWSSPHMVTFKSASRFFSRTSAGKFPLDVREIGAAFEGAAGLSERIQRWRDDRLGQIVADQGPVPLGHGSTLVLQLIPLDSFVDQMRFSPDELNRFAVPTLGDYGGDRRFNFDGVLTYATWGKSDEPALAYSQMFRSGRIEGVSADISSDSDHGTLLASVHYEDIIIRFVDASLKAMSALGVTLPVLVLMSFLRVKGLCMSVEPRLARRTQRPIDRDVLLLPDVIFDDWQVDVARVLQPLFDSVWNACGFPGSLNYDQEGQWKPRS